MTTNTNQNQKQINKIFDIARKTKPSTIKELKNIIIDYTLDNDIGICSLKKTILNFLEKTLKKRFDESNIQQAELYMHKGLSDNSIFFVRDSENILKTVIKVFNKPFDSLSGDFIKELSS